MQRETSFSAMFCVISKYRFLGLDSIESFDRYLSLIFVYFMVENVFYMVCGLFIGSLRLICISVSEVAVNISMSFVVYSYTILVILLAKRGLVFFLGVGACHTSNIRSNTY